MSRRFLLTFTVMIAVVGLLQAPGLAQYSRIATPFNSIGDSYFERIGVNFNFDFGPGFSFRQGSFNSAISPFGQFDPNSVARWGFGVQGRNGKAFSLNFAAGQGSTRTFTSQTPMVVVPNGIPGSVSDISLRPFVTGLVPVVGRSVLAERVARLRQQQQMAASQPKSEAREKTPREADDEEQPLRLGVSDSSGPSTAAQGDIGVAEIRRRQAAEDSAAQQALQQKVAELIERARGCEQNGSRGAAKIFYQQAAKRASGDLKEKLLAKVRELSSD